MSTLDISFRSDPIMLQCQHWKSRVRVKSVKCREKLKFYENSSEENQQNNNVECWSLIALNHVFKMRTRLNNVAVFMNFSLGENFPLSNFQWKIVQKIFLSFIFRKQSSLVFRLTSRRRVEDFIVGFMTELLPFDFFIAPSYLLCFFLCSRRKKTERGRKGNFIFIFK